MKIKSIITTAFATAVVSTACMVTAFAASELNYGDFTYAYLGDGTIEITGYSGSTAAVSIPAEIDGVEVTSIGKNVFSNKSEITSVTIPSSIDVICTNAFYNCDGITEITIPDGVLSVEDYAFKNCDELATVNMADSVVSLGAEVFEYTKFTEFRNDTLVQNLSDPMRIAGKWVIRCYEYAYAEYSGREVVKIPDGIYGIAPKAFYGCVNLTEISIPDSVEIIGKEAFYGSELLDKVTFSSNVKQIGKDAFTATPLYTKQSSSTVKYLNGWAIGVADGAVSAEFSADTIGLCDEMFSGSTTLTSINLPANLKYLGNKTFYQCSGLTSISIPDTVERIGAYCFYYAKGLTTVKLPANLTEIEDYTFSACTKLATINLPDCITRIGKSAFNGTLFTSLDLPSSLVEIGDTAFNGCNSITTVTLPSKLERIGYRAFGNCKKLASVTFPESLETVGSEAFYGCAKLLEIEIPASIKTIGDYAFGYGQFNMETFAEEFFDGLHITCYTNTAGHDYVLLHNLDSTVLEAPLEKPVATATAGNQQVTLSWEEIPGASYYQVLCSDSDTYTVAATDITATSATIKNLTNGKEYSFIVKAVSQSGASASSDAVKATPVAPIIIEGFKLGGRASDALRLNWTKNASVDGYIIEQYNGTKWEQLTNITNNATITYRVENLTPSTTYKFRITGYRATDTASVVYGEYSDIVTGTTIPGMIEGFKLGGRASDAIRLNWTKNTSADGYIIEQYNGTKWVRVTKITDNSTTTYRVENLTASTTYKFRIRAYNMVGSTALYGGYSSVTATTTPGKVEGFMLGGRASDALRVNWTKNDSADGYIIEQYDGSKWVRVTKIADNSTTTYRIEGLSPSTTYKFRICAYNMVGSVSLYSVYSNVTGTTIPAKVADFSFSGKTTDTLNLSWTKNDTADGYIIEMYDGTDWVRVVKLDNNATTAYNVTQLTSGTTYKFRIRAYNMVGSTALYSAYAYIDGTTD